MKISLNKNSRLAKQNREGGFGGISAAVGFWATVGAIVSEVGAVVGLGLSAYSIYNIVTAPSAGNALKAAQANASKEISSLTTEVNSEQQTIASLTAQEAATKKNEYYILAGAGAVILFLAFHNHHAAKR